MSKMNRTCLRAPATDAAIKAIPKINKDGKQQENEEPLAVTTSRFVPRKMNRFESKSPSALRRTIIEALRYSQYPMNLGQIVTYVRQTHNFNADSSLDEPIYNTLFDLCSAKMVVKVIGTAANEIRYHLPDHALSCSINLTFQGELSYEQRHKPSHVTERAWATMRRSNQQQAELPKCIQSYSKSRNTFVEFPCIPVTDSMIHESFATRAGIKSSVEGLQRPNTPIDGRANRRVWEGGDKPLNANAQLLRASDNDRIFRTTIPVHTDAEILGTKSLQNIHSKSVSKEAMVPTSSESTLNSPKNSPGNMRVVPRVKQEKATKNIKFLKEITDILDSHEPLRP